MIFFWKMVPNWGYFGQGKDFKLTTELSEKVQYSLNQAIKNGLRSFPCFALRILTAHNLWRHLARARARAH